MACYDGETLKKKIERGNLKVDEAIDIAIQVAEGLTKAHQKDIIHRDIKPANILVTEEGVVKIVDFGLAKLAGQTKLTKATTTLGTAAYMSPEQTRGDEVDRRSDIWSFGVVLYEMLTGQLPFKGDYDQAVMYSILNEDPKPVTSLRTGIPMELEQIVSKALEKESDLRYQDVKDMLVDLKRVKRDTSKVSRRQPVQMPGSEGIPPTQTATDVEDAQKPALKEVVQKSSNRFVLAIGIFLAVVIVMMGSYIFLSDTENSKTTMNTIPLTTMRGVETHPTFSPDGREIAFAWDGGNGGNSDIYVKLIGEGNSLQLTKTAADEFSPSWSPDGRYIAFARRESEGNDGIFRVPALGGPEKKLQAIDSSPSRGSQNLSWSPDGRSVAFSMRESKPYNSIFMVSVASLKMQQLTSPSPQISGDVYPSFSPDGKKLAFARNTSWFSQDIYIMAIPDGEPEQITFDNRNILGLTWTRDSGEIIYSSNRDGVQRLWRISSQGGTPEPVSVSGRDLRHPEISRDGYQLAYDDWDMDYNVWQIELYSQITKT
jgi:serine/threonine protein kinase